QWAAERFAPEQMLSLQVAAVGLALRAVIFEVDQSLQRVENKVDQIVRLLRAERLGEVLGDHRTLDALARRVRNSGRISAADWGSVDDLAPKIARDLETLRAHIRASLAEAEPGLITWVRAGEAEELMEEGWLGESLALLSVAQHNLALWHELRIAHVAAAEPSHLAETIEDARAQIESQRRSDQDLLSRLSERAGALVEPRRLDGLDPINVRRLRRARTDLESLIADFAEQRLLDPAPLQAAEFPAFSKSAVHLATTVGRGARGLATGIGRVVRRPGKPDLPQLPTGSEDQEPHS
ncbi:MAG TPA: hypothetical protein VJQ79_10365, partial [Acidimicrobiia bacterium]|nr:hypothetical protein [Acidimicrobiia bacterium]